MRIIGPTKIPTPRFNLNDKNQNPTLILMRITMGERRFAYSTGYMVNPKHWDFKAMRAKNLKGTNYRKMNDDLHELSRIAQDIFIEFDYGKISVAQFKRELDYRTGKEERPGEERPDNLFTFILQFIKNEKNKPLTKPTTIKNFQTVFNHLREFASEQGSEILYFHEIDWAFREKFVQWLYAPPREHSINNAAKIMDVVRQFMRAARRRGYHDNLAPEEKGFGVTRVRSNNQPSLNWDELKQLIEYDFSDNPRLKRVRDLFVVGALTGLRYSDWHRYTQENIEKRKRADGKEYELIRLVTKKTKTPVLIPLRPELKKILEEYDYQLPYLSSQKFNDYIKEACELAIPDSKYLREYSEAGKRKNELIPKWKKIGSHSARRSFASIHYEKGFPAAVLMQITGHSTEKQFFQYISYDQERLVNAFLDRYEKTNWD